MISMGESLRKEFCAESLIKRSFEKAKDANRIALMPFVMAGDPDLKTTAEILITLQENGADIIELGIPYSDPLADGPVIQAAAYRAINSGTTPGKVLEMLATLKDKLTIPIVLFTYSNPLLNLGMEKFCCIASESGASGIVVPDLPLEEAEIFSPIALSKGLDLILLVAPTTPIDRMKRITQSTKGFTYLVSVNGVTGERTLLQEGVGALVKELKTFNSMPVAVGFGISSPEQVQKVRSWGADGAIVGSALVKRIAKASAGNEAKEAASFCRELNS